MTGTEETQLTEKKKQTTGRRALKRMVRIYRRIKRADAFKMCDGSTYRWSEAGNLVRLDKDSRSPKQRKRDRRLSREAINRQTA